MDNLEGKLIEGVQKYPHLYDSSLKEYRDSIRIQNSWQEIARNLSIEIDLAKKKWKYIRESYVKSKKIAKGKSGDGRPTKPNKYFEMLAWLAPFIKHRPTESNLTSSEIEATVSLNYEDQSIVDEQLSPPASARSASPVASTGSASSKGRSTTKKRPRTEIEHAIMEALADKEEEDKFSNFGRTVADSLRKLSKVSQIVARKKINDILFNAEMAELTGHSMIETEEIQQQTQSSSFIDYLRNYDLSRYYVSHIFFIRKFEIRPVNELRIYECFLKL